VQGPNSWARFEMLCPKCNAIFDERFCPRCGLDLQLYSELDGLKQEIQSLRELVLAGHHQVTPPIVAAPPPVENSNLVEDRKMPPPLPPPLPLKVVPEKSTPEKTSAELAVGQKWLLGIGVLILIIGIGFFLKYAFDQEWIGPSVRISMCFLGGFLLLLGGGVCHRRNLRGLDVGIGAVGLGTLYLTSYAASQVDLLLPSSFALVLILLTTAIGSSLAALWPSQILAILSLVGGYLAPLLFASAHFDPWLYLGYLLILTLGGQILAYYKNWPPLYSSAAAFTWLSLAVWSQRDYRKEWFLETFVFTQVLFAAYSILPFLRASWRKDSRWSQSFLWAVLNGLFCCWYSNSLLITRRRPAPWWP
jgi:uncharacterized membrane protein